MQIHYKGCSMLQNVISHYFGLISAKKFSPNIQKFINEKYAGYFNIDLGEFAPASSYESLNALFTRTLNKARVIEDGFISPSDGRILYTGKGVQNQAFSIKYHSYDVSELLSTCANANELKDGFDYAGIYLSPRDYHHFHAPCDFRLLGASYVPGALWSVSSVLLKRVENLYAKNERVVLRCESKGKLFWLVFVGALNVGKISIDKLPQIKSNAKAGAANYEFSDISYEKGEHIGKFELGSTIVIIAQDGLIDFNLSNEQLVKYAQKIGDFKA